MSGKKVKSQNKKSNQGNLKVIIFGATGMIGQGVLRECLLDPKVTHVQTIGRQITGNSHPKLREIRHAELDHYATVEDELKGFDACFYCLGMSSFRTPEALYRRVTHDFAVAAAQTLVQLNPKMVFIFVSGAGADSSEIGKVMWARVKGKTENAILALPFRAAYVFRLGAIQALNGIRSKTQIYQIIYPILSPFLPLARKIFPNFILSTEQIGRAMITAAQFGTGKKILETSDIAKLIKFRPENSTQKSAKKEVKVDPAGKNKQRTSKVKPTKVKTIKKKNSQTKKSR